MPLPSVLPGQRILASAWNAVVGRVNALDEEVVPASTTVRGLVELATVTEAKAGTDTGRVVTPAGLAGAVTDSETRATGTYGAAVVADRLFGDGTTNARAHLQAKIAAAVTAGLPLHIPAGVYIIDNTLTLPSGVTVRGDGMGKTILRAKANPTDGAGYLGIVNADTTNGNDDITLSDFTYDGNRQNRDPANVSNSLRLLASDANSCDRVTLERVEVRNSPFAAMQFMNCQVLTVRGCRVDDSVRDGITVWYNSRHVVIADNIIRNTRDDCIALNSEASPHVGTQVRYVSITGNVLQQAADSVFGTGVNVGGAEDVTVAGNVVVYAQGFGIITQGGLSSGAALPSKRVTITGNTVKESGTALSGGGGIGVANTEGCSVVGNTVEGYYGNGIQLGSRTSCSGNTVRAGKTGNSVGILASAAFCAIVGNNLYQCTTTGIACNAEKTLVSGNTLEECCTTTLTAAYVLVSGGNSRNVVTGNIMRRLTTGTYGVRLATGAGDYNVVTDNLTQGFPAGQGISSAATGTNNVIGDLSPDDVDSRALPGGRRVLWAGPSVTNGANSGNAASLSYTAVASKVAGSAKIKPWGQSLIAGVAGETSTAVFTRIPAAIAQGAQALVLGPDYLTNSAGQGFTLAQVQADVKGAVAEARRAGIPVLICTTLPRGSTAATAVHTALRGYNLWLHLWSPAAGIPLVDTHAALVDPATGFLAAAYNTLNADGTGGVGDGTHPNNLAHKVLGKLLGPAVATLIRADPWPVHAAGIGLLVNPLVNTTANWTGVSVGTPTSLTADAPVAGDGLPFGNWLSMRLDNSAGSAGLVVSRGATIDATKWVPGDVLLIAFHAKSTDPDGAGLKVQLLDNANTARAVLLDLAQVPNPGPVLTTFTVPAGVTALRLTMTGSAAAGLDVTHSLGAADVFNLTAAGLADAA